MCYFFQDLNRLAQLTDTHLVFYFLSESPSASAGDAGDSDHKLLLLRDFRQDFSASRVRYFIVKKNGLHESRECPDFLLQLERYFFVRESVSVTEPAAAGCMLRALMLCCQLKFPAGVAATDFGSPVEAADRLLLMSEQLHSTLKSTILIVGYRGVSGKLPSSRTTANNLTRPGRCIFETLALIASPQQRTSLKNLRVQNVDHVVCSYGQNFFCRLTSAYRLEVLNRCLEQTDVLRDRVETLEVGAGGKNLLLQTAAAAAEEADDSNFKFASGKKLKIRACDKIRKHCRCDSCFSDPSYDENMSRGGLEKLLTHTLTLQQLVSMLGADSQKTRDALEEMSRLSVAAFDIESMTVPLDHNTPDKILPDADIDAVARGQHDVGIQKPIMLAHRDGLMKKDEPCTVFTLTADNEAGIYQMLRDYWKFVAARQRCARLLKLGLARDLLNLVAEYKAAYLNYCAGWRDPTVGGGDNRLTTDEYLSGWSCSVPGKLELRLRQLIDRYEVFSFYGSGYDQVLLENYLVPYLFEKKLRPRLEKKGNKVTAIKVVKCGVTFRDVVRLLSPGTSLRQFGQLFNLQQAKAHFPFGLLTGVEALLIDGLPSLAKDWNAQLGLTKAPVTQEEVDDAQRLFAECGCANLGDYLKAYLRLDVDILYHATQGWRHTIFQQIGVDFVQSAKFTISSLSNFAGDLNASGNLYVGQFFPNSAPVYRILRKGMRG